MELLNAQNREEYEAFVLAHPAGEFTQSLRWPRGAYKKLVPIRGMRCTSTSMAP